MRRNTVSLLVLVALFGSGRAVSAQSGAPPKPAATVTKDSKASQAKADEQFAGVWDGSMRSDHDPNSPMTIRITHSGEWAASLDLVLGQPMKVAAVTDIKIDRGAMSFNVPLQDMACKVVALVEDDSLKGEMTCGGGSGTFVLKRKK